MTDQALQSLGAAALAANQPASAVAALDAYVHTADRPALLFLRAEAYEEAGQPVDAADDYEAVYMRYRRERTGPGSRLEARLPSRQPGREISGACRSRCARLTPTILFNAKDWDDARTEYSAILPELTGADHERAELRILECGVALGASPSEMAALKISDADVDAERSYALAETYRDAQQEPQMVAAVEAAVVARAHEPLGRGSFLFGGELLLGGARPRQGFRLLHAARRAISAGARGRPRRNGAWRGLPS